MHDAVIRKEPGANARLTVSGVFEQRVCGRAAALFIDASMLRPARRSRGEMIFRAKHKKSSRTDTVRDDVVGEGGFEPPKSLTADLQSVPFGHSGIPPYELLLPDW